MIHMTVTAQQDAYVLFLEIFKVFLAGRRIDQTVNFILDKNAGAVRKVAVGRINSGSTSQMFSDNFFIGSSLFHLWEKFYLPISL